MTRAIFFDRDGVINPLVARPDGRYTSPWNAEELILLPQVREAFQLVASAYTCFVVTNQPHVGVDMTDTQLHEIHNALQSQIPEITAFAYCSVQGSSHYKPSHGMLLDLMRQHHLGPAANHYMIGDRWKDIVCGHNAGVQTIFVGDKYDNGGMRVTPRYTVPNIYAACELIMEKYHAESRSNRN